jgi:hypothetical protein
MNKENIKIDISSTAIEKGIDLAKGFLEKLIVPSIEEAGLLFQDQVTFWRFKKQVRTLNKTQEYCIKHNISPKSISLKLLCPLLDNAGIEEDEYLQDKWAILLGNMVDSEQNVENHVFPFLLGQMSKKEFVTLEKLIYLKNERVKKLKIELTEFQKVKEIEEEKIKKQIAELGDTSDWQERQQKWTLERELKDLERKESKINLDILKPEYLPEDLEEFEIYNLIRLGIIMIIKQQYGYAKGIEIPNNPHSEYIVIDDLEVEIEDEGDVYIMTELGTMFMKACSEKK